MTPTESTAPTRRIAGLAWPILVGQLAVIANSVIDTAMTSRYSATDLAALSIAVSIYVSVFVSANGVLQALSPIIGQLFGARKFSAIAGEIKQGMWLALFLTLAGSLILVFPQPLLSLAQASPELNAKASLYLQILAFALPASLGFRIYSAFNHAIARPKAVMLIQLAALGLKVPLNGLFIFGGLGVPALGGPGCAVATAITTWMTLLAGWLILRTAPAYQIFRLFGTGFVAPRWGPQCILLKLGLPMGLSYLIEVSAFTFMALFIARMGDTAVAGHQLTANFVTVLYMLPLSIASATATLAAHAIGASNRLAARQIANAGIRLAAMLALCLGILVWLTREWIVQAYTPDPVIIANALPLFVFVGAYHLFDALQVTAAFVLRAYKIAVIPTAIYAVMLWGVGLGGGYVLGFDLLDLSPFIPSGAAGFWIGNTASVMLASLSLLWYLRLVHNKTSLPPSTQ